MQKIAIIGASADCSELAAALAARGMEVVEVPDVQPSCGCADLAAPAGKCPGTPYPHTPEGPYYFKTREEDYWTPAMVEAKAAAWRAQQPRHQSQFTKSQPTTKARKAARRRAKAGRKSSR